MTRSKSHRDSAPPSAPGAGKDGVALQRKPSAGDLPENLQSGIESLSGRSMADVKVQFNSPEPGKYGAHAFARGTSIHVAPGQEQHLPHEAWHVAQQKQGRVSATGKIGGMPVNTDQSLEREADTMGAKAMQMAVNAQATLPLQFGFGDTSLPALLQLKDSHVAFTQQELDFSAKGKGHKVAVGKKTTADLVPHKPLKGSSPGSSKEHDLLMKELRIHYPGEGFLRGHLLNDNLGGPGIWENMFPITAKANGSHLYDVEKPVKQALLDAYELNEKTVSKDKYSVHYAVEAVSTGRMDDFIEGPKAMLHCSWEIHPKVSDHDMPGEKGHHTGAVLVGSNPGVKQGQNAALLSIDWGSEGSGRTKQVRAGFKQGFYESPNSSTPPTPNRPAKNIAKEALHWVEASHDQLKQAKGATEKLMLEIKGGNPGWKEADAADDSLIEADAALDMASAALEDSKNKIS
ncbi:eCIS core domain-containing protein [Pseudokordiimonas caeni]|uniref:eCIS core domain-containing protein n=1 Tax=Pseudokordiimonas caeni TaxID=2997908 RepID=UPI002810AEFB|nr:DUF4157 domain-containing protein [Pseudokordiimonas caeni]